MAPGGRMFFLTGSLILLTSPLLGLGADRRRNARGWFGKRVFIAFLLSFVVSSGLPTAAAVACSSGTPTVVFLTTGTSWTVPSDWNSSSNTVECIGAGGNGGSGVNIGGGAGAAGGDYAKIQNLNCHPPPSLCFPKLLRSDEIGACGANNARPWKRRLPTAAHNADLPRFVSVATKFGATTKRRGNRHRLAGAPSSTSRDLQPSTFRAPSGVRQREPGRLRHSDRA